MVATSHANDLKPETLKAWDEYIQSVNAQLQDRLNRDGHFLSVDETRDRLLRLVQGQILVEPVGTSGHQKVPHGLIHDWYGAVFVPGATIEDVLAVLADYDHYSEFYRPTVVASKLLERTDKDERFSLLMLSKVLFVTAALDGAQARLAACGLARGKTAKPQAAGISSTLAHDFVRSRRNRPLLLAGWLLHHLLQRPYSADQGLWTSR